ncbi:MAG: hypothetical protein ABL925_18190 [Methylococcales bacterium]
MKNILPNIIILHTMAFLTMANKGHAQDVNAQSMRWQAVQVTFLNDGKKEENNSQFIVKPSTVEWIQKNGQKVYTFEITETLGTWPDVAQDGSITYQVRLKGKTGTISVRKSNGSITLRLTYRSGETTGLNREYQINHFERIAQ